ncbi:membrane protein [Mycobacterium phage Suigeneris]|uniref:Membrane protein n=1 Tax=Mycobacterium phage Suigeneris TaxID=2776881 RepID=A0A7M1CMG9_9CAUD|nr:membrane protein [Mycobacterium phage Suigeneris]
MRRSSDVTTLGWLLVGALGVVASLGWGGLWWSLRSDPYRPSDRRR